ncbi:hypothetical protein EDB85DRAFT_1900278 [Lactarius pseudohatsudake]|nr:hypothetical protein EDB85DRAFT_1900278 [Lactarius pseudohatsudake]
MDERQNLPARTAANANVPVPPKADPWRPFFKTREDFQLSDCIEGKGSLAFSNYSDIRVPHDGAVRTFQIPHRPLWDWAVDLILDSQLAKYFEWDARKVFKHDGKNISRVYDEPWTADSFWNFQSGIPKCARPLCFILYADKSKLSSFGSEKAYPVIARCANLPTEIRNRSSGVGDPGNCSGLREPNSSTSNATSGIADFTASSTPLSTNRRWAAGFSAPMAPNNFLPGVSILSADYEEQMCSGVSAIALSFNRLHSNNNGVFGHHLWKWFKGLFGDTKEGRAAATKFEQQYGLAPRWRGLHHFSEVMKVDFTDGGKNEDISMYHQSWHALLDRSSGSDAFSSTTNSWFATLQFNISVPSEEEIGELVNYVKNATPSDGALPNFIEQLERELRLRCSPRHDMTILPLLASVKAHLGDDTFGKHFTDVNDGSETHRVTDIELLHYLDALIDRNLSNQAAYRNRTESHVYSLLRRFAVDPLSESPHGAKLSFDAPWVFGLAVKTGRNQILHQYTPRSDVFFSIEGFPHVLLEISSDKYKRRDHCRMLLQASCLIRLGNMLISDKSPTFFVKAFYIDNDYHADEFTLYQKHD